MSRQPMARMDIDTRWAYHRKCRALQSRFPRKWPAYWCAYLALLGESWVSQQRVTLDDAWLPTLAPVTIEDAVSALSAVGLVDAEGRIPEESWTEWAEPAFARIRAKSEGGRRGAVIRHGGDPDKHEEGWHSLGNATRDTLGIPTTILRHEDAPRQPASQPSQPANHAVPNARNGEAEEPYRTVEGLTRFPVQRFEPNAVRTLDALSDRRGVPAVVAALREVAPGIPTQPPSPWQLVSAAVKHLEPFSPTGRVTVTAKGLGPDMEEVDRAFGD